MSVLVSDDLEALSSFSRDVGEKYPVVVAASAHSIADSLQRKKSRNIELTE